MVKYVRPSARLRTVVFATVGGVMLLRPSVGMAQSASGVGSAVAAGVSAAGGDNIIWQFVMHSYAYFMDPVKAVSGGLQLLGMMCGVMSYILPAPASGYFARFAEFTSGDTLLHLEHVFLFLVSPVITPSIVVWCINAEFVAWEVCTVVWLAMIIKGQIWAGGAT